MNIDCCIGSIISGPNPAVPGDPATHFYTLQAWSISGSGRVVHASNVVVLRYDMDVPHYPLEPGDAVIVNIVGSKTTYTAPRGAAHWKDC